MDAAHISSPRRKCIRSDETPKYMFRLRAIWELSSQKKSSKRINGLFKLLGEEDLWVAAYKKLAPNPASMTVGFAPGTIDSRSLKNLRALRDLVCEDGFVFGTTRRAYIAMPSGYPKTPMSIPEFQDRLVQEVIRTLLWFVYEPVFCLHGFRIGRSQHSCLKYIKKNFRGANWIIEGTTGFKSFDAIPHATVMKLLSQKIQDQRFLKLVRSSLKAKILMLDCNVDKSLIGSPQGFGFASLLSNIVLHELDCFVNRIKRVVNKWLSSQRQKPIYARRLQTSLGARSPQVRIKLKKEAIASDAFGSKFSDPRLMYARYADDFIVGILGPKKLAVRIQRLISAFLKKRFRLTLDLEKAIITRTLRSSIPFLGYLLNYGTPSGTFRFTRECRNSLTVPYCSSNSETRSLNDSVRGAKQEALIDASIPKASIKKSLKKSFFSYQGLRSNQFVQKIKAFRNRRFLRLMVDMKKIIESLSKKGFCNQKGDSLPNFRFFQDPQSYTISRASAALRGIGNYYHLADNKVRGVQRISFIIQHSLAMMFAAKYKLRTRAQVFKIAGRDFSKPLARPFPSKVTDLQLSPRVKEAKGHKKLMPHQALPFTRSALVPRPDLKP